MNTSPPFPLAMAPPETQTTALTVPLLQSAVAMSRKSPRKRVILPLHKGPEATLQRMFNAMQPGTYVRPHKHWLAPKCESVIVLQGAIGYITFDEAGTIEQHFRAAAGEETFGLDSEPGIFHTFVALAPDTVLFEVKQGPYEQLSDKEYAAWAPEEQSPEAAAYLEGLTALFTSP